MAAVLFVEGMRVRGVEGSSLGVSVCRVQDMSPPLPSDVHPHPHPHAHHGASAHGQLHEVNFSSPSVAYAVGTYGSVVRSFVRSPFIRHIPVQNTATATALCVVMVMHQKQKQVGRPRLDKTYGLRVVAVAICDLRFAITELNFARACIFAVRTQFRMRFRRKLD